MARIWLPGDSDFAKAARGWPSSDGKKPTVAVEIDWNNHLARGLERFYIFQSGKWLIDLASGKHITSTTGVNFYANVMDVGVTGNVNIPASRIFLPYTISARLSFDSTSGSRIILPSGGAEYGIFFSGSSVYHRTNGDAFVFTASQSAGVQNTWTLSRHDATNATLYKDDKKVSDQNIASGGNTFADSNHIVSSTWPIDGKFEFVAVWSDRELTDAENADFARNPFQLLKPANETPFLIGTAAAGGAYTLTVTQGTATVTGQSADMLRGVQLDVTEQALTVTGQSVTMTYTPVGSYDLIVTEGVATVSGQSVDLLRGLQLDVTGQALTVTGQSVDMTYAPTGSYNLGVTAGTATVTGQLVDLLYSRVLTVTEQAVTVTGQLVTMTYAQPGAYTLTVTQGTATVTGQSVTLTYSAALDLATVYARLTEVWQILGLDPNNPMTVTPTSRVSGDISQTISGDGITSTTVTRDP